MKKKSRLERKYMYLGILFTAPALIIYAVFMAYPLIRTFYLSFMNYTGFGKPVSNGIANYKSLLSDSTLRLGLKNTLYFALLSTATSVILGIFLAWLNLYLRRYTGQVTRTILFTPNMIAPTITGLLFLFIFTEESGLLNSILRALGLNGLARAWLANISTAKPAVVLVQTWRQFGLTMILCYAGLQGIPMELIESARIDGASDWKVMSRILVPLIKPQIELSLTFTLLGGLKIYDSVVSLTAGGPARQTVVLPMWILENAFTYSKYGYASTMCVLFVVVILIFKAILGFLFRGEAYEY